MGTDVKPEISEKNKYWIPKERFYELKHFCRQYPTWKKAYNSLTGLSTRPNDLALFNHNNQKSDPTAEDKRERRVLDSEKHKTELAFKEQQAKQQEAQQQAELAIKTRQLDGGDADRVLKEQQTQAQTEQQMAELALRERELAGKEADRAREEALQTRQLKEQEIDRYVRIGIAAAELVLPLAFYGIWMRRGFKFEESGAYTSGTFKNLFNRFKPTKKG